MLGFIESLTFATALDLNMGYHQIKIKAHDKNQCKNLDPLGKKYAINYLWVSKLPQT
jgi:hypothetical protein